MQANELLLIGLATWRLAYMLVYEDAPFRAFDRLRTLANHWEMTGELLSCVRCVSVWVAALLLIIRDTVSGQWVINLLAISAIAVIVHVSVKVIQNER